MYLHMFKQEKTLEWKIIQKSEYEWIMEKVKEKDLKQKTKWK